MDNQPQPENAEAGEQEEHAEAKIQHDILMEFGAKGAYLRIWRQNTGLAYGWGLVKKLIGLVRRKALDEAEAHVKKMRPVQYGLVGQADIIGIIMGGRAIAIEVKRPGKFLEPEQATWASMFRKYGGLYICAHSVDEVYEALATEGVVIPREEA